MDGFSQLRFNGFKRRLEFHYCKALVLPRHFLETLELSWVLMILFPAVRSRAINLRRKLYWTIQQLYIVYHIPSFIRTDSWCWGKFNRSLTWYRKLTKVKNNDALNMELPLLVLLPQVLSFLLAICSLSFTISHQTPNHVAWYCICIHHSLRSELRSISFFVLENLWYVEYYGIRLVSRLTLHAQLGMKTSTVAVYVTYCLRTTAERK